MLRTQHLSRLTRSPLLGIATLIALSLIARPAAATQLDSDSTVNYPIAGDVFVGSSNRNCDPPSSPTVNITGGTFGTYVGAIDPHNINVNSPPYNDSTVNVSGGSFGQFNGVSFLDETKGAFTFFGQGLSYAPDPGGKTLFGGTDFTLTGQLLDSQNVTGEVVEVAGTAAIYTLVNESAVSEASTAPLLGLGTLCLAVLMLTTRRRPGRLVR